MTTTKVEWFKTSKIKCVRISSDSSPTTKIVNLDFCLSYEVTKTTNVITLKMSDGTSHTIDFGVATTNDDVHDKLTTFLELC